MTFEELAENYDLAGTMDGVEARIKIDRVYDERNNHKTFFGVCETDNENYSLAGLFGGETQIRFALTPVFFNEGLHSNFVKTYWGDFEIRDERLYLELKGGRIDKNDRRLLGRYNASLMAVMKDIPIDLQQPESLQHATTLNFD